MPDTVKRFQLIYDFAKLPDFDPAKNYTDYELEEMFRKNLTEQIQGGKSLYQFSVQLLTEPVNWRVEAKNHAQEILNNLDPDYSQSVGVLIQQTDDEEEIFDQLRQTLDLDSICSEKVAQNFFFGFGTQDAMECLEYRNLGCYDQDEGIASTKTIWQFLQQRATLALERAVSEKLEELIKAKICELINIKQRISN